jgi:hypothetical protein
LQPKVLLLPLGLVLHVGVVSGLRVQWLLQQQRSKARAAVW